MRTALYSPVGPILDALIEVGGSGQTADVLAIVERTMHFAFKDIDFEKLPSNPNIQRRYNTAQWARNALVKEGLMRADSPRGVWEISEEGRAYVAAAR